MDQIFLRKLRFGFFGGILLSFLLFSCVFKNQTRVTSIRAVPQSSSVILKINDISRLSEELSNKYDWWKSLSGVDELAPIRKCVSEIDSLCKNNPELMKIAAGRELWVALSLNGNSKLDYLLVTSLDGKNDRKYAEDFIEQTIDREKVLVKKRKYNKIPLYELDPSGLKDFPAGYSFVHNLLIYSNNSLLVEEA